MKHTKFRHGDISFHLEKLPAGAKKVEHDGSFVLALGEHTGNKHVITKGDSALEIYGDADGTVRIVSDGAVISHSGPTSGHKPIVLDVPPVGYAWRMKRQRERNPWLNVIQRVDD